MGNYSDQRPQQTPPTGTPSLELPADLRALIEESQASRQPPAAGVTPPRPELPRSLQRGMVGEVHRRMNARHEMLNNFADGGMVSPQGTPVPSGAPMLGAPGGMQMNVSEDDINQFMAQHPEQVQQIAAELAAMVQSGELSPQQLQMGEQLATLALRSPEMYPRVREFAVRQGLIDAADIPEQFDQGILFAVILAARAAKEGGMVEAPRAGVQNMAAGGYVTPGTHAAEGGKVVGPGTGTSDSIPINVSAGEYVIPAHVVQMKGKEFFDKLLANYSDEK